MKNKLKTIRPLISLIMVLVFNLPTLVIFDINYRNLFKAPGKAMAQVDDEDSIVKDLKTRSNKRRKSKSHELSASTMSFQNFSFSVTSPNRAICEDGMAKCTNSNLFSSCEANSTKLCTQNNNDSEPICINSALGKIGIARCGNINPSEIPLCTDGRAACLNGTFKCDDASDMKLCSSANNISEPLCLNGTLGRIRSGFCLGSSSSSSSSGMMSTDYFCMDQYGNTYISGNPCPSSSGLGIVSTTINNNTIYASSTNSNAMLTVGSFNGNISWSDSTRSIFQSFDVTDINGANGPYTVRVDINPSYLQNKTLDNFDLYHCSYAGNNCTVITTTRQNPYTITGVTNSLSPIVLAGMISSSSSSSSSSSGSTMSSSSSSSGGFIVMCSLSFTATKITNYDNHYNVSSTKASNIGDINNDGINDLVTIGYANNLVICSGNENVQCKPIESDINTYFPFGLPTINTVTTSDFNNDGIRDIAISSTDAYTNQMKTNFITILLGKGNSTFNVSKGVPATNPYYGENIVASDFDGDGLIDIATTGGGSHIVIFPGNGDGTFKDPSTFGTFNSATSLIATNDFNEDGKSDIVTKDSTGSYIVTLLTNSSTCGPKSSSDSSIQRDVPKSASIRTPTGTIIPLKITELSRTRFALKTFSQEEYQEYIASNPRLTGTTTSSEEYLANIFLPNQTTQKTSQNTYIEITNQNAQIEILKFDTGPNYSVYRKLFLLEPERQNQAPITYYYIDGPDISFSGTLNLTWEKKSEWITATPPYSSNSIPSLIKKKEIPSREDSSTIWNSRDNKAYIIGGKNPLDYSPTSAILEYDPVSENTKVVSNLPSPKYRTSAVWDPKNNKAYIFGGKKSETGIVQAPETYANGFVITQYSNTSREISEFDPTNNTIRTIANLPEYILSGPHFEEVDDAGKLVDRMKAMGTRVSGTRTVIVTPEYTSVWDTKRNVAYLFGGYSSSEILEFNPAIPSVTKIVSGLSGLGNPIIWNPINNRAYSADISNIYEFNLSSKSVQKVATFPMKIYPVYISWNSVKKKIYVYGYYNTGANAGTSATDIFVFEFDPVLETLVHVGSVSSSLFITSSTSVWDTNKNKAYIFSTGFDAKDPNHTISPVLELNPYGYILGSSSGITASSLACKINDSAFNTEEGGCKDLITSLVWGNASTTPLSYPHAVDYCQRLIVNGFDDWRIPSINEFMTIVPITGDLDFNGKHLNFNINQSFWSSTDAIATSSGSLTYHTTYNPTRNAQGSSSIGTNPVLCIRDGSTSKILPPVLGDVTFSGGFLYIDFFRNKPLSVILQSPSNEEILSGGILSSPTTGANYIPFYETLIPANLKEGDKVKLCYKDYSDVCSSLVTVSGKRTGFPGISSGCPFSSQPTQQRFTWNDANVFCKLNGGRLPALSEFPIMAPDLPWNYWTSECSNNTCKFASATKTITGSADPNDISHTKFAYCLCGSSGTPQCPTGQISCNGSCKTGNCCTSIECPNGQACQNNTCACLGGQLLCSGACVNGNCCSNDYCSNGQVCQNNNCTCLMGQILCNGLCVTGNCCTNIHCSSGQSCQNNSCISVASSSSGISLSPPNLTRIYFPTTSPEVLYLEHNNVSYDFSVKSSTNDAFSPPPISTGIGLSAITPGFNPNIRPNTQVKICYKDYPNICSSLVDITGTPIYPPSPPNGSHICIDEQWAASATATSSYSTSSPASNVVGAPDCSSYLCPENKAWIPQIGQETKLSVTFSMPTLTDSLFIKEIYSPNNIKSIVLKDASGNQIGETISEINITTRDTNGNLIFRFLKTSRPVSQVEITVKNTGFSGIDAVKLRCTTISCTDSDYGKNYGEKGSITLDAEFGHSTHDDSCLINHLTNPSYVSECSGQNCFLFENLCEAYLGDKLNGGTTIQCSSCKDGACLTYTDSALFGKCKIVSGPGIFTSYTTWTQAEAACRNNNSRLPSEEELYHLEDLKDDWYWTNDCKIIDGISKCKYAYSLDMLTPPLGMLSYYGSSNTVAMGACVSCVSSSSTKLNNNKILASSLNENAALKIESFSGNVSLGDSSKQVLQSFNVSDTNGLNGPYTIKADIDPIYLQGRTLNNLDLYHCNNTGNNCTVITTGRENPYTLVGKTDSLSPIVVAGSLASPCADTDGGMNYGIKGTVSFPGIAETYTDACMLNNNPVESCQNCKLDEYYCLPNASLSQEYYLRANREEIPCKSCTLGKCSDLEPAPTLNSASINNNTLTIEYLKNNSFDTIIKSDLDEILYDDRIGNYIQPTTTKKTISFQAFQVKANTKIKLCYLNYSTVCSQAVTVVGIAPPPPPPELSITSSTSLPDGTLNSSYSYSLLAMNGSPPYSWSWIAGSLPFGLSLNTNGTVSGTPSQAGSFSPTIKVTDSTNKSVQQSFSIKINSNNSTSSTSGSSQCGISIRSETLPKAEYSISTWNPNNGKAYIFSSKTYEYSPSTSMIVTKSEVLPSYGASAALNPSTNKIYFFGGYNNVTNTAYTNKIVEYDPATSIITTKTETLPSNIGQTAAVWDPITNKAYIFSISSNDIGQIFEYDPTTSTLTIKPETLTGLRFKISCAVWDSTNNKAYIFSDSGQIFEYTPSTSKVNKRTEKVLNTRSIGNFAVWNPINNKAYLFGSYFNDEGTSINKVIEYDPAAFKVSIKDESLPFDLQSQVGTTFAPSTIWATTTNKAYIFGGATDASGTGYIIEYSPCETSLLSSSSSGTLPLVITSPTDLPDGNINNFYSQTLGALYGSPQYNWSWYEGSLPVGLSLNPNGLLSGTPSQAGTFKISAKVTDSMSQAVYKSFTIKINSPDSTSSTSGAPQCGISVQDKTQTLPFGASSALDPATNKVYVFGGRANGQLISTILEYNLNSPYPYSTTKGALPAPRDNSSAVWNPDTKTAYIFGGADSMGYLGDILEYDPVTYMIGVVGALPLPRASTCSVWDPINHKAYIFGGIDNTGTLNQIVEYDPTFSTSIRAYVRPETLPIKKYLASAVWNPNVNKAYIFGGGNVVNGTRINSNQILEYDPLMHEIKTREETLPSSRILTSSIWNSVANKAYIYGGSDDTVNFNQILEYDPAASVVSNRVTISPETLPSGRVSTIAAWDSINNKTYIFGGYDHTGYLNQVVEHRYCSGTATDGIYWKHAGDLTYEGSNLSSVFFNNKIYTLGREFNSTGVSTQKLLTRVEGENWNITNLSNQPVLPFGPLVVFNNKLWIVPSQGIPNTAQKVFYSNDGITWTEAGNNSFPVALRDFTVLSFNNKLWVIGGYSSIYSRKVYYSSDGITWTEAGNDSLPIPLIKHSSVVFNNKMWIIGGIDSYLNGTDSRKVYYSSDGITWTEAGNNALPLPMKLHASVVFNNKIWVIGGAGSSSDKVFYSSDGINWSNACATLLPFSAIYHSALEYNNKIWVIDPTLKRAIYSVPTTCSFPSSGGTCNPLSCPAQQGCSYINPTYQYHNSCLVNCGTLNCPQPSSSSSSGTFICSGNSITSKSTFSPYSPRGGSTTAYDPVTRKVYIFGGGSYETSKQILEYNPLTNSVIAKSATLPTGRSSSKAVLYQDQNTSKIYILGGRDGTSSGTSYNTDGPYSNQILAYDPSTDMITVDSNLPQALVQFAAAYSPLTRSIYTFGGSFGSSLPYWTNAIYKYDPLAMTTTQVNILPSPRDESSAVWCPLTNKIYVIGGMTSQNNIIEFNPLDNSVTQKSTMVDLRRDKGIAWNPICKRIVIYTVTNPALSPAISQILEYDPVLDKLYRRNEQIPASIPNYSTLWAENKGYIFGINDILEHNACNCTLQEIPNIFPSSSSGG